MKTDKIFTLPGRLLHMLLLACIALVAGACNDDDTEQTPYLQIVDDLYEVNYDVNGGTQQFVMYSSYGRWSLVTTYAEDEEWVTAWPSEGVGDARFSVKIAKNAGAGARQATLNVVVDGASVATIAFNQAGAEPTLEIGSAERTASVRGETFNLPVKANLPWVAQLDDAEAASWVTLGEFADDFQSFSVTANEGTSPRRAEVVFRAYGTSLSRTFVIHQGDRSSAFELAEKTTIAELLKSGEGKISQNLYIEGSVISDRTTRNYPVAYRSERSDNTMFVDDGTAGLWIEFNDAADNTCDLDDDVVIHMYGQSIVRDEYTNGLKIAALTSSAVQSATPGKGVEPIVIEDISQLARYENRLVTLKEVEFVLPYGMLCNINEASGYYGDKQSDKYLNTADYNDLTLEYGHYLRDKGGNLAKLYTTWSFTERSLHLLPEGSGDITGIVNKRYKADRYRRYSATRQKEESWCIRVRRETDITCFGADASTRHARTVMQFGPWNDNKATLSQVPASVGKGQLYHSVSRSVAGTTSGNTSEMYWAWAHARCNPATFDPVKDSWLPAYGNKVNIQYIAIMAQGWWKNTAAVNTSTDGCCWILSDLSTEGYDGRLWLEFTASSNTGGPIEFLAEWADSPDAATWNPIGYYVCANWHCDIHAPEYVFELPEALRNKSSFCIRLQATLERNASDDADSASGTSRLGVVRISCLN